MTPAALLAVGLGAAALAVALYAAWKIRRVHLRLYDALEKLDRLASVHLVQTSRQLEALAGLYLELGLERVLGPTRGWCASPDFLALAVRMARTSPVPDVVVECGSGTSTVVLAQCMKRNGRGHVHSLDHDPMFAARTRAELQRHGLSAWATVHEAPLVTQHAEGKALTWYDMDALQPREIDLLVIDGPPAAPGSLARYPALPLLRDRLREHTVVVLDDAARADEQAVVRAWKQEFPGLRVEELALEKGAAVLTRPVGVARARSNEVLSRVY